MNDSSLKTKFSLNLTAHNLVSFINLKYWLISRINVLDSLFVIILGYKNITNMNSNLCVTLVLFIGVVLFVQSSAYVRRANFNDDQYDENGFAERSDLNSISPRGFGCSGPTNKNEYKCNQHCKSNGFKGGYCNAALLWFRCDCYK
ncbi:unnamed protein product [Rotaria magnacalcarata]